VKELSHFQLLFHALAPPFIPLSLFRLFLSVPFIMLSTFAPFLPLRFFLPLLRFSLAMTFLFTFNALCFSFSSFLSFQSLPLSKLFPGSLFLTFILIVFHICVLSFRYIFFVLFLQIFSLFLGLSFFPVKSESTKPNFPT
jgi:hypothetical protein